MKHERFKGDHWHCLRGEGPTDLILKTDGKTALEEALLTFRVNETYCEISFKNGQLRTGRMQNQKMSSNGPLDVGAQMASTTDIDRSILRQGIYILMSAPTPCTGIVQPLLDLALKALRLGHKEHAA